MGKPVIGLVPLYDEDKASYWMLPGYMKSVEASGGVAVMLPLTAERPSLEALAHVCDGLLFTGGQDVSPGLYGEGALPECGEPCLERDAMETELLGIALDSGKPILGICRGLQFLNVHLGGTLYQDIPTQMRSDITHRQEKPYDKPSHSVRVVAGTPLHSLIDADEISVNSLHHQGIKEIAPPLAPMAQSPDGLVEAAYMPEVRFVMGVQWHPEFLYDKSEHSRRLFRAFVEACA